MLTDLLLVFVLILLNGLFAMSEIAIVSSRRARLVQLADGGSSGARHALQLASEPTRFLSSVQVGITSIGILNGAIGEAAVASRLRGSFEQVPLLAPYSDSLALGVMVVGLSYVSLIVGELVPKRLALTRPEAIASIIARPMQILASVGRPLVFQAPRRTRFSASFGFARSSSLPSRSRKSRSCWNKGRRKVSSKPRSTNS